MLEAFHAPGWYLAIARVRAMHGQGHRVWLRNGNCCRQWRNGCAMDNMMWRFLGLWFRLWLLEYFSNMLWLKWRRRAAQRRYVGFYCDWAHDRWRCWLSRCRCDLCRHSHGLYQEGSGTGAAAAQARPPSSAPPIFLCFPIPAAPRLTFPATSRWSLVWSRQCWSARRRPLWAVRRPRQWHHHFHSSSRWRS